MLQALFAFLMGDSQKKGRENERKSAVDILYNGTSQATRGSPTKRQRPFVVRARQPSEAAPARLLHIPAHYLRRGAR